MNTYTHKDKRGGWGGWVAWRPIPPLGVFVHASDFVGKLRREDSGLVRGVGVASVGAVAAALAVVAILVVVRFWARASRRSLRRGSSRRPRCSRKTTTSCPKPRYRGCINSWCFGLRRLPVRRHCAGTCTFLHSVHSGHYHYRTNPVRREVSSKHYRI